MKILVTGYKGFIGQHICKFLENAEHSITKVDIADGYDVSNPSCFNNFENHDIVIHLANLSYVPASYEHPYDFYNINFNGTLNVLEFCRKNNAKLIYFSSYVYGSSEYLPIDEKHIRKAFNPYAQSKVICEDLCEGYFRDFNVDITIFRPFNIYGPGQNKIFLIPSIIDQLKKGKIFVKDDRPKRDYIHINDIVQAVKLAVENSDIKNKLRIYNLGSGISYSVKSIAELIIDLSGKNIEYICNGEQRPNEVMDSIADISLIKQELDWIPKIDIREGLKTLMNNNQ